MAADQPGRPPVSDRMWFRPSPYGGLVVTQWVSQVQLDGREVFPLPPPAGLAVVGQGAEALRESADPLADELLADLAPKAKTEPRTVDRVDAQYKDWDWHGVTVGPRRIRLSQARAPAGPRALLTPGDITVPAGAARLDVPCYPVTFTAVREGGGLEPFAAELTWKGRDLLRDCLFEYSPEMPLGDISVIEGDPGLEERLKLLAGTAGGRRRFRSLTVYLPESREVPYVINGAAFTLAAEGVVPAADAVRLAKGGPFALALRLPAPSTSAPEASVAVVRDLDAGWSSETGAGGAVSASPLGGKLKVDIKPPAGAAAAFELELPRLGEGSGLAHATLLLVGRDSSGAAARLVAAPESRDTRDGVLRLAVAQAGPGASPVPDVFKGTLVPWGVGGPDSGATATELEFRKQAARAGGAALWEAAVPASAGPGLYGLALDLQPASSARIPVALSHGGARGSVSLFAYHNREDYLRGEEVQLCALVRAAEEIAGSGAEVLLSREGAGTALPARVDTACPAGTSRACFVRIDTSALRPGRYEARVRAPGLIAHPCAFTVHPAEPVTTFALFKWHDSFSTELKASGRPAPNCLLGGGPTRYLHGRDLEEATRQDLFPSAFAAQCRQDPFFPVPERTVPYEAETEREIAAAMRLGIRYGPSYGWGLSGQEADWNPRHTVAEDLDRTRRIVSMQTQRFRDFGNYAGQFFNWYASLGGHYEDHPPMDGHQARRNAQLGREMAAVWGKPDVKVNADQLKKMDPADPLYRSADAETLRDTQVSSGKYRVGAFARAWAAWTERAARLPAGAGNARLPGSAQAGQAGPAAVRAPALFADDPAYLVNIALGWFDQPGAYPPVYFGSLPVAGVHAYTDYGFSPFQPLFGVDYYASGVADKPVWACVFSPTSRDVALRHALMCAARGADGLDLHGVDENTGRFIADFLTRYGPAFRALKPQSSIAMLASYRQQTCEGPLAGKWMGYLGGPYYEFYSHSWYARRPAAVLSDEEIALDRLKEFDALFLLGQRVPLPAQAMKAIGDYAAGGGTVFKDTNTASFYPGRTFALEKLPPTDPRYPKWDGSKYKQTKDAYFVGSLAGYEAVAPSLAQVFASLPPPPIGSDSENIHVSALRGRDVHIFFAANNTHPWPGIEHPTWNFWTMQIMAAEERLTFDRPYVLYDLFDGGREIRLAEKEARGYALPISFSRCGARAYVALPAAIASVAVRAPGQAEGPTVPVEASVTLEGGRVVQDPMPCEITVLDEAGRVVETLYRALGPGVREPVPVASAGTGPGSWRIRVRELASGRTAEATVARAAVAPPPATADPILVLRERDVRDFLSPSRLVLKRSGTVDEARANPLVAADIGAPQQAAPGTRRFLVLIDPAQLREGQGAREAGDKLVAALRAAGREAELQVADPESIVELPLRWALTWKESANAAEVLAGARIGLARPLRTKTLEGNGADFLHPESGYGEPGPKYRVARDVILLGSPGNNRFIADLHESLGQRMSEGFPGAGGALVQVVYDAFVTSYDALSIQAPDAEGLGRAVERVVACLASPPPTPAPAPAADLKTSQGAQSVPLENPLEDRFGASVGVTAFLGSGDLLVSGGLQANNYLVLDPEGRVKQAWMGMYGVSVSGRQGTYWVFPWWGVPGYVDKLICAAPDLSLRWMMSKPSYSMNYTSVGWPHPGSSMLVDPAGDDVFVSGCASVLRVTPEGKVAWKYDDMPRYSTVSSFRFPRDIMLHDVDAGAGRLLAAAFSIEPYATVPSKIADEEVILFDARTGAAVWRKPGFRIDHSACAFSAGRIVLADAAPGRERVAVCAMDGREEWSMERPRGVSWAQLTADREWLIARPGAPRQAGRLMLAGPAEGLEAIRLADKRAFEFPLDSQVHALSLVAGPDRVLVSTIDGRLRCFEPGTRLLWERAFPAPVSIRVAPDGRTIVAGTQTGKLLWLDARDGSDTRAVDLMGYNVVTNVEAYVQAYTRDPGGAPLREAEVAAPEPVNRRCAGAVSFSPNLWAESTEARGLEHAPLTAPTTLRLPQKKGQRYILSVFIRPAGGAAKGAGDGVGVAVRTGDKTVCEAVLPAAAGWEERLLAWRAAADGEAGVTLTYRPAGDGRGTGMDVRGLACFAVEYPSPNLFAQKGVGATPGAPAGPASKPDIDWDREDAELGLGSGPPAIAYFIPNDVDLRARSAGAKPFAAKVWPDVPFDGALTGQDTSWLAGSVVGKATYATLTLTFRSPVPLTALAIHEDLAGAPASYTDTYAVFARSGRTWRKLGHVIGNRSPFNLFTFDAVEADEVVYLWLKSGDGHARIAEFEGYGKKGDLF